MKKKTNGHSRWALASICVAILSLAFDAESAGAQAARSTQPARLALATSMHRLGQAGEGSPRVSGLPALLRLSVARDPQVRGTDALAAAAKERVKQALSRLLPVLGVQVIRGDDRIEIQQAAQRRENNRASASLNWNLLNGGTDYHEMEASERDAEAAQEDLRAAREEVGERIANAYAKALYYHELLPESGARLDRARKLDQQVFTQVAAGKLSDIDGVQSAVTLLEAEIDHAELHSEAVAALARLTELTGAQVDLTAGWPEILSDGMPPSAGVEIPSSTLAAAQLRAEAAHSRVPPAVSLLAPKIDLQYEHELYDRAVPPLPERRTKGWTVMAKWEIPLGGEKFAQRSESSHRAVAADEEVARVHQNLRSELAGMPGQIKTSRSAVVRLKEQVERYGTLVNAGGLQFEAGRRTLEQLAQLGQNSFAAHRRLADERLKLRGIVLRQLTLSGGLLERLRIDDTTTAQ